MSHAARHSLKLLPLAWLLALLFPPVLDAAEDALQPRLLTRSVGDPRAPQNFKLALDLPETLAGAALDPSSFEVYVCPTGGTRPALNPRYRAGGVLVWICGGVAYLDVRQPPLQSAGGDYAVHVRLVEDGRVLAAGTAPQSVRYAPGEVDVALLIDGSLSMRRTDPERQRVDAARAFIEMAVRDGRIASIGVVSFADRARVLSPLSPTNRPERLLQSLDDVEARGGTDIDAAFYAAAGMLDRGRSERKAVVFLTDGRNEPGLYRNAHEELVERGIPVYAIGLSEKADRELLALVAGRTGGTVYDAADEGELMAIYLRIAAELGRRVLLLRRAVQLRGPPRRFGMPIDPSIRSLHCLLDRDARAVTMALQDPRGDPAAPGEGDVVAYGEKGYQELRILAPARGVWTLDIAGPASAQPAHLAITAETSLYIDAFPPVLDGRSLVLAATVALAGRPQAEGRVRVLPQRALGLPGVDLYDDGKHRDGRAGDGVFAGELELPEHLHGELTLHLRAWGITADEYHYVRQTETRIGDIDRLPVPRQVAPVVAELHGEPLDFGVVVPGETKRAAAPLRFSAAGQHAVRTGFEHPVEPGGASLPAEVFEFSLREGQILAPGVYELGCDLRVPAAAESGCYEGALRLRADAASAVVPVRLRVAAVTLSCERPDFDFGEIVAAREARGSVALTLQSPRPLPVRWRIREPELRRWLFVESPQKKPLVPGKRTSLPLLVRLDADTPPGEYAGTVELDCGATATAITVRFSVPGPPLPSARPPERVGAAILPAAELEGDGPARPVRQRPLERAAPERPITPPRESPAVTPADDEPQPLDRTFTVMQRSLVWTVLLLLAVLSGAMLLLRRAVRSRMLRFFLLSGLVHLPLVAFVAIYVLAVHLPENVERKRSIVVNLVNLKESMGFALSSEEEAALQQATMPTQAERRFIEPAAAVDTARDKPVETPATTPVELPRALRTERIAVNASAEELRRSARASRPRRTRAPSRSERAFRTPAETAPATVASAPDTETLAPILPAVVRADPAPETARAAGIKKALVAPAGRPVESMERVAVDLPAPSRRAGPARRMPDLSAPSRAPRPAPRAVESAPAPRPTPAVFREELPAVARLEIPAEPGTDAEPARPAGPKADWQPFTSHGAAVPREDVPAEAGRVESGLRPAGHRSARQPGRAPTAVSGPEAAPEAARRQLSAMVEPEEGMPDVLAEVDLPAGDVPRMDKPTRTRMPAVAVESAEEILPRARAGRVIETRPHPARTETAEAPPLPTVTPLPKPAARGREETTAATLPERGRLQAGHGLDARQARRAHLKTAPAVAALSSPGIPRPDLPTGRTAHRRARGDEEKAEFGGSTRAEAVTIVVGELRQKRAAGDTLDAFAAAWRARLGSGTRLQTRRLALGSPALYDCQILFLHGTGPLRLRSAEVDELRAYLARGGFLWLCASRDRDGEAFMASMRRELARAFPQPLAPLPPTHPLLRAVYDLHGAENTVSLEGLSLAGRLAVAVLRVPQRRSEEMLRAGVNVMAHALGGGELALGGVGEGKGEQVYTGPLTHLTPWQDFTGVAKAMLVWKTETWGNRAAVDLAPDGADGQALRVRMHPGVKSKAAVGYVVPVEQGRRLDLRAARALVADLYLAHPRPMPCSLVLTTQTDGRWSDFETAPVTLRQGWNRQVMFPIAGARFRSRATGWDDYDAKMTGASSCGKVGFFFYNGQSVDTNVLIDNIRWWMK